MHWVQALEAMQAVVAELGHAPLREVLCAWMSVKEDKELNSTTLKVPPKLKLFAVTAVSSGHAAIELPTYMLAVRTGTFTFWK